LPVVLGHRVIQLVRFLGVTDDARIDSLNW
jgi:hypothetical protein